MRMENNNQEFVSELSALIPQEVDLKLGDKEFVVGKFTMRIDVWIEQKFGMKRQEFLKDLTVERLARLTYRLFTDESKRKLPARMVKEMDDEGTLVERKVTGWEMLADMIQSPDDVRAVETALFKSIGMSQPLIDRARDLTKKKMEAQLSLGTSTSGKKKKRKKSATEKSSSD